MDLIILRHGIAIDRDDPACPPDPERYLTRRGRERSYRVARGLRRIGVAPERILCSPWLRAMETAEIVAEVLGVEPQAIEPSDLLLPDREPVELLAYLESLSLDQILCVGHAPHLDLLLTAALGIQETTMTRLGKAGAAAVRVGGHLQWILEPRMLRRLGAR